MLFSQFQNPSSKPSKTNFQYFSLHFVLIILLLNILMANEAHCSRSSMIRRQTNFLSRD
jgi:hypothetical protein